MDVDADASPRYENALKVAVNRHDISVINIFDIRERELPDVGMIRVVDAETGEQAWVDTSSASVRSSYSKWSSDAYARASQLFRKFKVDQVSIATDQDYVRGLIELFKNRS